MGAVLGRVVDDYQGLVEVCRQRAAELAISRSGIDEVSGLPNGMAGKILGDRQVKKMGPLTLGPLLQTLGLKMLIIEDAAATAKTLARRTPVQASQQRFGESHWRNTPKLPAPSQPAGPPSLTIVRNGPKRGVTKYG
jgi:hypothetical protein